MLVKAKSIALAISATLAIVSPVIIFSGCGSDNGQHYQNTDAYVVQAPSTIISTLPIAQADKFMLTWEHDAIISRDAFSNEELQLIQGVIRSLEPYGAYPPWHEYPLTWPVGNPSYLHVTGEGHHTILSFVHSDLYGTFAYITPDYPLPVRWFSMDSEAYFNLISIIQNP